MLPWLAVSVVSLPRCVTCRMSQVTPAGNGTFQKIQPIPVGDVLKCTGFGNYADVDSQLAVSVETGIYMQA